MEDQAYEATGSTAGPNSALDIRQSWGDVVARTIWGWMFLSLAQAPLGKIVETINVLNGEPGFPAIWFAMQVASAALMMVGFAVLAGMPLRGVNRAIQVVVTVVTVASTVSLARRLPAQSGLDIASHMVTLALVALVMVGATWAVIRAPRINVFTASVPAVALVIAGIALAIVL